MNEEAEKTFKEMERTANLNKPATPSIEDLDDEIEAVAEAFLEKEKGVDDNDK